MSGAPATERWRKAAARLVTAREAMPCRTTTSVSWHVTPIYTCIVKSGVSRRVCLQACYRPHNVCHMWWY
eukprot:254557-Prymnesium_polylepis.1